MSRKCIIVTEEDYKQAMILSKVMLEGKFELKGDAVPMVSKAQMWLANHLSSLRNPIDYNELQKVEEQQQLTAEEKPKKAYKRSKAGSK